MKIKIINSDAFWSWYARKYVYSIEEMKKLYPKLSNAIDKINVEIGNINDHYDKLNTMLNSDMCEQIKRYIGE